MISVPSSLHLLTNGSSTKPRMGPEDVLSPNSLGILAEDIENLLPLAVDDEFITEDEILPQPEHQQSIITGFLNNIRLQIATEFQTIDSTMSLDDIIRTKTLGAIKKVQLLTATLPEELAIWQTCNDVVAEDPYQDAFKDESKIRSHQLQIIRADIHVTSLWIQITLLDDLDSVNGESEVSILTRNNIYRQLLYVLGNISFYNLEPNGHALILKLRRITMTLIDFSTPEVPFDGEGYLHKMIGFLIELEKYRGEGMEQQSWVKISQESRSEIMTRRDPIEPLLSE
jgi:hypothetical protein